MQPREDIHTAMKRILVTGGVGFIGSGFVRRLMRTQPDVEVYVVDAVTYAGNYANLPESIWNDARFFFWQANICDRDLINRLVSKVDAVVHFAAETHVDLSIYDTNPFIDTDVKGTQILLDAVRRHPIERLVHISTSEVYGTALASPMSEDHPLNPRSPYASAKCGADRLVYSYVTTFGLPAVIMRPFNNYGPYQHVEKAIPCFITQALHDLPIPIHGDGVSSRDWLFVEDCCAGIERALAADIKAIRGEVINLGTGIDTTILTVAQKTLQLLNKPESLIQYLPDRPGQVTRHIASTAKAETLLGWRATTTFDAGLRATVEWYLQHEEWWTTNTHKEIEDGAVLPHLAVKKARTRGRSRAAMPAKAVAKSSAVLA